MNRKQINELIIDDVVLEYECLNCGMTKLHIGNDGILMDEILMDELSRCCSEPDYWLV